MGYKVFEVRTWAPALSDLSFKVKRFLFSSLWMRGSKFHCPVCQGNFRRFVSLNNIAKGVFVRPVVIRGEEFLPDRYEFLNIESFACPRCGAPDKARLIAQFFLDEGFENASQDKPFLHFAPEAGMEKFMRAAMPNYRTSSFPETNADFSFDLTNLGALPDCSIGGFVCSHVLEHVEEDSLAVRELHRVLDSSGFGLFLVPIMLGIRDTWEDPSIVSESDRWTYFGQGDHVRVYSKSGFVNLLLEGGFSVEELGIEFFGAELFEKIGVPQRATLYKVSRKDSR